ncbi:elongin-A3 member D-like [Cricetulus griseus]|uniref:Elongin-A3 member D-like n=1 Tax=Cricetulus griseus TaxID=10029 RepID=A0A9J7JTD0_CRIGR|nr:elongin-A3 member D-like [Cricetulus griseus]
MEMEAKCRLEALHKLRERLCTKTEPRQLYKTLKKLSSQPMLGDILEEIGFKQTIKLMKKQQLLVPFAKDLAARWSEQSQFGSQPDPGSQQDFDFPRSPKSEIRSNSPEDKRQKPAFWGHRENGSQVLEVSSSSPQLSMIESMDTSSKQITNGSPNAEPAGKMTQRGSFSENARHREPGTKTLSRKPEAGPAKQSLSLVRAKSPGPCIQEDHHPASFEACLDYDCSPSSSVLPPRKRKRKSTWKAEAQSPGAKVPRDKSPSCEDLNLLLVASPFPETTSNLQTCFPQDGPEDSSLQDDLEAAPWACRKYFKTPVVSGGRRARPFPQNSNQGRLAKQHSRWETHCQPALEEGPLWSLHQEDSPGTHINTAQRTGSQSESQTHLKMQESLQLRLQALCARIQNTQTKKPQGRQTKTVAFQAQVTRPGEHADSGPGPEASTENLQSLPEASGPGLLQRSPCPRLGGSSIGSNMTRAKKPAPLMAKALKDYKKW